MATLYIFSGLPGSGKSTLAQGLALHLGADWIRIDSIEEKLREMRSMNVTTKGYEVAYQIAADNLRAGLSVIADSCNAVLVTRLAWEQVAAKSGAACVNIVIKCSDKNEHRRRIETRRVTRSGLKILTWSEVENREYQPWSGNHIDIETAQKSEQESIAELCHALGVSH